MPLRGLSDFQVENGRLIKEFPVERLDDMLAGLIQRGRDLNAELVAVQVKIDRINAFKTQLGL